MPNDVNQRTQQLISSLRELASSSNYTGEQLGKLESIIQQLNSLKLDSMREASNLIVQFNRGLKEISTNISGIKEVANAFSEVAKASAKASTVTTQMSALGGAGGISRGLHRGWGPEEKIDKSQSYKNIAELARIDITQADVIWREVERKAQDIAKRQGNIRTYNLGEWMAAATPTPRVSTPVTTVSATELATTTGRDITKEQGPINTQSLTQLGLSSTAVKNLNAQLQQFGITTATVSKPVTELSTGITTLTVQSIDPLTRAVKNLTTHLDRNGNVLVDTQKRFRSFGSAVMRDVTEVLKWTIAISAIYGPIRKMGEMLDQMKKIQLDMVDVQVALGSSTRSLTSVFEASSKIATETSSSLQGVIEGYGLAVAASASGRTEMERMVTTESLLKNSMILSKLANTDQKQALDTLVGALSQLGMSLTQGTQLLDSWVAVSKKANVSVNQMAQSFAIVGSAAEEAGLSYNELNALVGTLAQNTTLSGNELGNAIRGIIAAMQTDKAQQEFAKYGIATKNVTGDFRDLMDILRELKVMQQGGLLDEKAMGALMQAGGAGARRGAQLSAIVKNLPQTLELIVISENAGGEAAQAMGLEMATLDAATTRLNNSFASLAQSLGTEGGILGILTKMADITSKLIGGIKSLIGILKGAAPVLGAFMLMKGIAGTPTGAQMLGANIPTFLQQMFSTPTEAGGFGKISGAPLTNALLRLTQRGNIGAQPTGAIMREGMVVQNYRPSTWGEFGGGLAAGLQQPFLGKMNISSMLGPALIASTNIGKEGGLQRAGAGLAGGGIMAALTGSPLWATVGSMIATGFYDNFLTFEGEIAASWGRYAASVTTNKPPETLEETLAQMDTTVGDSLNYWELFNIGMQRLALNVGNKLPNFFGLGANQTGQQFGQAETELGIALAGGKSLLGIRIMDEETAQLIVDTYNEFIKSQLEKGLIEGTPIPLTQVEQTVQDNVQALSQYAATASADIMQKALDAMATGASGSVQNYITASQLGENLGLQAGKLITAQGMAGMPVMGGQQAVQFMAGLESDELNLLMSSITSLVGGMNDLDLLKQKLGEQNAQGIVASDEDVATLTALNAQIEKAIRELPQLQAAFEQASLGREAALKLKEVIEVPEGLTAEQRAQVISGAEKLWREYLEASGLSDAAIEAYIAIQQDKLVAANGEIFAGVTTKAPQEFVSQQQQNMGLGQNFGLEDLRSQGITTSMWPQIMASYKALLAGLQKAFPLYKPEESPTGFILKDGFEQMDVDLKILNLLMGDLVDLNREKGLEGLYNLPSGATFWVPVSAYSLDQQTRAGMGGGGGGDLLQQLLTAIQNLVPTATTPAAATVTAAVPPNASVWQGHGVTPVIPVNPNPREEYPIPEAPLSGYSAFRQAQSMPTPEQLTQRIVQQITANPVSIPEPLGFWDSLREFLRLAVTQAPGTTPPATTTPEGIHLPGWLERLRDFFRQPPPFMPQPTGAAPQGNAPTQNAPISTALNLSVDSNIQLLVDGRTLASIIKPYLYEDLIRYGGSSPTSTSRSVIG